MSVEQTVDWQAAMKTAESLGARTRELALEGMLAEDAETLKEWCLQQSSAHIGAGNSNRSLSYFELAVIVGHRPDALVKELRKPWAELLQEAERLTVTIRGKVEAEAKAEAEAKRRAEEEKRKAEEAKAKEEAEANVVRIASDEDEGAGA